MMPERAAFALLAIALTGCFPGHCEGAFRWLSASSEGADVDRERPVKIAADASFRLNSDSATATAAELVARAKVSAETFFLVGAGGRVDATIEARAVDSAHSCASAASFTLTPSAPLARGDYVVVLALEGAAWPAVFDGDVSVYEGKRALVRRYLVE